MPTTNNTYHSETDMDPPYMSDLHAAARAGSVQRTLDALILDCDDDPVNIDEGYDDEGWTALMLAAEDGYVRVVNVLIRLGADVSAKTKSGHTALHLAVSHKHLSVTKALIRAGADISAVATRYSLGKKMIKHTGYTPLHLAAREGFCEGILTLLRVGANVQARLGNGSTPLFAACYHGHLRAIKILLQGGADPLILAGNNAPLDAAARKGHLNVVRELVERFSIIGCALDEGENALAESASLNHVEMMNFLLDRGAVDITGEALSRAIENGCKSCFRLLMCRQGGHSFERVKRYVNISRGYDNPLLYSLSLGRGRAPRFAKVLIEAGVDTSSEVVFEDDDNAMGTGTPLAIAKVVMEDKMIGVDVREGVEGVIRLLRQRKAAVSSSWAWPRKTPRTTPTQVPNESWPRKTPRTTPTQVPNESSKMLWAAMTRYNGKMDGDYERRESEKTVAWIRR